MISEVFNIDCMEGMKQYPDKYFDVCITDLPYGIGVEYNTFSDTEEDTISLIKASVPEMLRVSKRVIITSGIKMMYYYPKPNWVGAIYSDAGIGSSAYGFCCWQPILIYGNDPKLRDRKGRHPDSITYNSGNDNDNKFHPVPKPLKLWEKVFSRWIGLEDKKILDPFLGSGTSRIVCDKMGLDFTGFELDKDYFEAQEKRWSNYKAQLKMFV